MTYPDNLDVRPLTTWPGSLTAWSRRQRSPFSASLSSTLGQLRVELRALGAQRPVLEVAILRSRGEVVGPRGVPPRPFDVDEAVRLYQDGMTSAQVARQLGVKGSRVQDALRDRGVLRQQLGTAVPLDEQRARDLYATGATVLEVARALGVRTVRIADLLREHGELRTRGRGNREAS